VYEREREREREGEGASVREKKKASEREQNRDRVRERKGHVKQRMCYASVFKPSAARTRLQPRRAQPVSRACMGYSSVYQPRAARTRLQPRHARLVPHARLKPRYHMHTQTQSELQEYNYLFVLRVIK